MECPKCGVSNLDGAERCRMCGTELMPKARIVGPTRNCPFCGAINNAGALFCSSCNKKLGDATGRTTKDDHKKLKEKFLNKTYADLPASAVRNARSSTGGVLLIMVAVFAVIDIGFTMALSMQAVNSEEYDRLVAENPSLKSFLANIAVCEAIRSIFAILTLLGGIVAIRRINFGFAVLGGVTGILLSFSSIVVIMSGLCLTLAGFMFVFSLIGLVLVAVSRREFLAS